MRPISYLQEGLVNMLNKHEARVLFSFQKCKHCVTLMIKYRSTHNQLFHSCLFPVASLYVLIILCSDKGFN